MKALIYNLLPWIIAGISLLGIIILVLRKIPVLLKLPSEPLANQIVVSWRERLKMKLQEFRHASLQPALTSWLEKTLRRVRLFILKIDRFFVNMIERVREKSQTMKARSRAWVEQHRLKKIEKLQVLEKLDQAEVSETIKKTQEAVQVSSKKKESIESEEKKLIEAIAKDPRDIVAYRQLGFLYLKQGNKKDAKNCFKEVLKIDPGDLAAISKMKELE